MQQRIESWESVTADSAEMKSCADYRAAGLPCRAAQKGPGSVRESMKWLQGWRRSSLTGALPGHGGGVQ